MADPEHLRRSAIAAQTPVKLGYKNVMQHHGGMNLWVEDGYALK